MMHWPELRLQVCQWKIVNLPWIFYQQAKGWKSIWIVIQLGFQAIWIWLMLWQNTQQKLGKPWLCIMWRNHGFWNSMMNLFRQESKRNWRNKRNKSARIFFQMNGSKIHSKFVLGQIWLGDLCQEGICIGATFMHQLAQIHLFWPVRKRKWMQ